MAPTAENTALLDNTNQLFSIYAQKPITQADQQRILLLIEQGINVNKTDQYDCTPLGYAVLNNHEAVVAKLLSKPGINVNHCTIKSPTPLQIAAFHGWLNIMSLLLESPEINVNKAGGILGTPLNLALASKQTGAIRLLLTVPGIDVQIPNTDKETPVYYAFRNNYPEALRLLLRHRDTKGELIDFGPQIFWLWNPAKLMIRPEATLLAPIKDNDSRLDKIAKSITFSFSASRIQPETIIPILLETGRVKRYEIEVTADKYLQSGEYSLWISYQKILGTPRYWEKLEDFLAKKFRRKSKAIEIFVEYKKEFSQSLKRPWADLYPDIIDIAMNRSINLDNPGNQQMLDLLQDYLQSAGDTDME